MKLLLDTDIGSDIDDAICLAYLLMHPECDLLGITTVSGEPQKRAALASAICRHIGKDVPIYPGADHPLIIDQRQTKAQQGVQLKNWSHQKNFPPKQAVSFLAERILANPNEVTLLTIGPLTNIALLFSIYPEVAPALGTIVIMGGHFLNGDDVKRTQEWNILLDPHAARIVYQTSVSLHQSIGLDVTKKVRLAVEEIQDRFTHPALAPVIDFAQIWFDDNQAIIFHDPLAAVSIFDPDVCEFQEGRVGIKINPETGLLTETTFDLRDDLRPHQIAVRVDVNRFFKSFFDVFK